MADDVRTTNYDDGTRVVTTWHDDGREPDVVVTHPPGSREANRVDITARIRAAIVSNTADHAQNDAIITQAAALMATTGTRTTAQLSGDVRAIAQGLKILAGNSTNALQELTALGRLILGDEALDATTGTLNRKAN